jgi:poly(3-hydroxybutyrate) depolymerase
MSDPATGDRQITIENNEAHFIVSIPANYDATHPYPLGFGFHGRNRTGPNCHDGDCIGFQAVMQDEAILVYMTSLGGTGWEGETERELNVTFFETVLGQMKAEYCVDESRVFVAGTSSGANFTNVLGCRFSDQLLAVAPVAGGLMETENCGSPVAALVIHGVDDYHVPFQDGIEARDFYVMRNGCMAATDIPIPTLHDEVVEARESHQCATYQGCPTGLPVTWCEHSEGGYDGSTHGWPLFGGQAIWDFVSALP